MGTSIKRNRSHKKGGDQVALVGGLSDTHKRDTHILATHGDMLMIYQAAKDVRT